MIVTITNDAFYIIIGLLIIYFFPHLYLLLIFVMMEIVELIEYINKIIHKYSKII